MKSGRLAHGSRWRRSSVLLLLLGLAVLTAACGDSQERHPTISRADEEPGRLSGQASELNLVLVTLDTTRADALGAYGQPWPTSPRFDELASRGVLFEQVATSSPETLPAHSTIFTGQWPFVHGVRANAGYVLPKTQHTLAEILREHGYETAAEVAAPVLNRATQITQGFQHYRGAESEDVVLKTIRYQNGKQQTLTKPMRVGSDISAKGIDFLREHRQKKFFLWLHFFDAHEPYFAPPAFNGKIPESRYHAEVASADFELGRFLDELDRLGLRDKTLVVVTADHGEGLGEHDEPSHSYFVYETTMRVPLILVGPPSLPAGKRLPSLVRTLDILPTTLDLLGLAIPEEIQGVSLTPLITGRVEDLQLTSYGEATRFLTTFGLPPLRTLRSGRWKYIHKVNAELYDLEVDPRELHNRASEHPEIVERLREKLEALLRPASHESAWQDQIDPEKAAELVALGYADRGPTPELRNLLDSLELSGEDPREKIGDTLPISTALGLLQRGLYEETLKQLLPVRARNPKSVFVLELLSGALHGLGRDTEAATTLRDLLEIEPCASSSRNRLALLLRGEHNFPTLLQVLAEGAKQCPHSLADLDSYAWALATLPDPALRDGALAERLIRKAIADSNGSELAYLDTLAAALAEQGRFQEAAATESELIETLERSGAPTALLEMLREHRKKFRSETGIRDPEPSKP